MDNIIRAVFCGSRYTTTKSVFQIDKGDVLKFVGLDLPEYYEVHFSNSKNDLAKRVIATGDSVVIPPEFMKHGKKEIFAWVYLTPEADVGYTPYQVTIPLNLRSDISDAEPDPEQDDIVEQAIAALNDGVERAETAADNAESAATEAKSAAENIQQTVEDALQEAKESGEFDGRDGANGVTYTPTVDAEGVISWTNDGGLPNPQHRNIMGPQGEKLTYADLTAADKADLIQGPIAEAQTAAVEAVNQAGAAQEQAVTNKGAEVLESIPADYTELSGDVDDLKSALTLNENGGYFEQTVTHINGGYIQDYDPGNVVPYSGWKYTDYINISGTKNGKILIKMYSGSGAETVDGKSYNAWYDADKNYVNKLEITNGYLDVPDNAVYIRLSCRSAFTQKLSLYYNGTHDIINADAIDADYINFVTWNVGIFKDGTNKPTTEEAPAQIVAMKKMVGDKNPNFLNAQEYVDTVDAANTISSANLMKFKLPYKTSVASNKCFSKLEILNAETITFTSGSGRYCKAYEVKLNNKAVTIINAHLSLERDPSTYRNADIQQLITYMQTKEYVILSGDFNVASDAEYTPFTTSGFVLCNGGDFGWFDTWPVMENMWEGFTPDWPCNHLDNIIVSSNIVPQYVEKVTCSVSDHAPLFAILRID